MRALEEEVKGLEAQLEARKVIDRAKGRLMDDHGLKEAEAFRFIQTEAMSRRAKMVDVANQVLAGEVKPG
jgi:response regulator NasT